MRRRAAEDRKRQTAAAPNQNVKYRPGLDPLEAEAKITDMVPLSKVEQNSMAKIVKAMLRGVKKNSARGKALQMWQMNLAADNVKGIVQQEFVRDFWAWLLGRGKQKDHDKTPW